MLGDLPADAGVVENILGRVLDTFQKRVNSLLRNSLARTFAENASFAQQMAAEPSALLLGKPVAFYVGKPTDTTDAFHKAIQQTGFGTGEEVAQVAVLSQLAQVWTMALKLFYVVTSSIGRQDSTIMAGVLTMKHMFTNGIALHVA